MFTQEITPIAKPVVIDIPDEYLGRRLTVTVEEAGPPMDYNLDPEKYTFENWMKFIHEHPVDLSDFKFDREEANER